MASKQLASPPLLLLVLLGLCGFQQSLAFSTFPARIPNGDVVHRDRQPWAGVGHFDMNGGGPRNPFGQAFDDNGKKWDRALCELDSDDDGETNGMELGDPDCTWQEGQTPSRVISISHPGFNDSTTVTEAGLPAAETPTDPPGSTGCFDGASDLILTGTTTYACYAVIGGGIEIHWTPDTSAGMIDFTLRRQMTDGFMALAVTDTLGVTEMNGGEALIVTPTDWDRYSLGDGSVSAQGKQAAIPFTFSAAGTSVTQNNGWVEFKVTGANLAAMTKYSVPTNLDVSVPLIWSRRDSGGVGYHGGSQGNRNGHSLNFATGASEVVSAGEFDTDDVEMHGILQITAWTFLAPFGIFLKRLGHKIPAFQKILVPFVKLPLPYILHILFMMATIVLSFWGFMIAIDKFDPENLKYGHGATAIITIVLALSQPLPAVFWQFLKPAPGSPNFKMAKLIFGTYHPLVGTAALILGTVTVFTGIQNYNDKFQDDDQTTSFRAAALAGTIVFNGAVVILSVIVIAFPNLFKKPDESDGKPAENQARQQQPAAEQVGLPASGANNAEST